MKEGDKGRKQVDLLDAEPSLALSEEEQIGAFSWTDNATVNFISNIHFNDTVEVTRRKKGEDPIC
jgi:hypothetical protein